MVSKYVFCTVASRSHLRYAVGLGLQLRRFHPDVTLNILVIDPPEDLRPFAAFPVSLIPLPDLEVPEIADMKIYFTAFELSNALKPFLIKHLFDRGYEQVIYLDSDLLIVGPFDELLAQLNHANFVLTPHILTPSLDNTRSPTNVLIADVGIYNGGMWGMSRHENALGALGWLMEALPLAGFADIEQGKYVDQKMLPLAADLFPVGFHVLRKTGYNIAYWNLQERNVRKVGERYFVDDEPVTFFHLSGFREDSADRFSVLSDRHTFDTRPVTADIVADYLASLPRDPCFSARGYAFDRYAGRRLTRARRRYYFKKRTFSGYRAARIREGVWFILRGVKRLVT